MAGSTPGSSTAGVLDGDALAGAVPAGVDQISLGTALLHLLDQLHSSILGGGAAPGRPGRSRRRRWGWAR